ncbi:MAG: AzlD domain-containing protein [Treponema sp.]|nr:AzlD domain-containing protein [Treponema sp.]
MTSTILSIAVMSLVTALLRFLPFLIFHGDIKTPDFIIYLGKVLPYAIMGMLLVFCLKSVDFKGGLHGIPELISILLIVIIHCWKRNTMLSILLGTLSYVLIVNFIA